MLLRAVQRSLLRPLASAPSQFLAARIPPRLLLPLVTRSLATSTALRSPSLTETTSEATPPAVVQTGSLQIQPDLAPTLPHESLALLAALKAQPSQYITIHIHKFPFLVTVGDLVRLPFRLKEVNVGDRLRITHASVLGSRDYTMKGNPYIDESLFECRAMVVEETSEPLRKKEKTKRRQRRIKTVKSKHPYTVLRISELVINDAPAVTATGDV
ncbi:hypothetical protein Q9L58_001264 [Maublancomyces gigas]|uniref:Large ribosomal subunit protein bL21m n=1 Tax=Discina gigas TaxID=1032678 RepID=A0ABR3GUW7_9PEZI